MFIDIEYSSAQDEEVANAATALSLSTAAHNSGSSMQQRSPSSTIIHYTHGARMIVEESGTAPVPSLQQQQQQQQVSMIGKKRKYMMLFVVMMVGITLMYMQSQSQQQQHEQQQSSYEVRTAISSVSVSAAVVVEVPPTHNYNYPAHSNNVDIPIRASDDNEQIKLTVDTGDQLDPIQEEEEQAKWTEVAEEDSDDSSSSSSSSGESRTIASDQLVPAALIGMQETFIDRNPVSSFRSYLLRSVRRAVLRLLQLPGHMLQAVLFRLFF